MEKKQPSKQKKVRPQIEFLKIFVLRVDKNSI